MKLILDIEVGSNGGFVVTNYKNMPTALQRLTGIKQEKEQLAFADGKALVTWLEKHKGG